MLSSDAARLCFMTGAFVLAAATNAGAIECREDYQIVQGRPISTPYCRDGYLAEVARQYGYKISAETMRNNPSRKEEICRFIGDDIRVQTACSEVTPLPHDSH
ncbi:MAG: hypothetical protein QM780_17090 [Hyphomicrobium sp.]|uniref:hypothetical protein n=1 Tax=Hyphomicrobium sp. TaxID=82 RepID=UPI0039E58FDC